MKWFDAELTGMVWCWIEGDGLLLGPSIGYFVGYQTGNWMPKTNVAEKKKTNLAGALNLAGPKMWRPDQN